MSGPIPINRVKKSELHGKPFDVSSQNGNIYIPVWVTNLDSGGVYRYAFLRVAGSSTQGVKVTFRKTGNIWRQYQSFMGRLVKASYPAFTDIVAGSGVTTYGYNPGSDAGGNWVQIYNIGYPNEYITWTATSTEVGMDKLVIDYQKLNVGQIATVKHTRGETTTILGEFDTYRSMSSYVNANQITIDIPGGLAEGDVITIANDVDESGQLVQIGGIWLYDSTSTPEDGDALAVVGDLTDITSENSTMEMAHSIAPTGSTTKYIGGAHQGGSNCIQVVTSETFTVDGAPWTLAVGYKQGLIIQKRVSQAYYDSDNQNIAALTEYYTYDGKHIQHCHTCLPTEALDANPRYIGMLAMPAPIGTVYTNGPSENLASQADSTNWPLLKTCRTVNVSGVASGYLVCMETDLASGPLTNVFSRRTKPSVAPEDNQKLYWDLGGLTNSTDSWSGGWSFWVEAA